MKRILLVEDDMDVLLLLEHTLREAGYHVESASTERWACSYLDRRAYDLVLTDGMLPDGTGMAVADKAIENGVKALIITGYASKLHPDLIRHPYLVKPLRPHELLREIDRVLAPARTESVA
jgi:two-component system, OmpR family, response regulator